MIPAPLRRSSINTVATLAKLADRLPNNQVDTGTEVTPIQHLMVMRVAVQLERDIKVHRPTKSALSGSLSFEVFRRSSEEGCIVANQGFVIGGTTPMQFSHLSSHKMTLKLRVSVPRLKC